jgi:putative flippase GtrA
MSMLVRLLRFVLVGGFCFLVQLAAVHKLRVYINPFVANAIAFVFSAQVNFMLSKVVTWRDRSHTTLLSVWRRYSALALFLTLGNSAVFWFLDRYIGEFLALFIAVAVTTVTSFLLNHFWVFVADGHLVVADYQLVDLKQAAEDGVAIFLPAYNEAENLPYVVAETVAYFFGLGIPHAVIVVNDGSTDDTATVVAQLQLLYQQVQLVEHAANRGYGSALQTGFINALATGYQWIGYCDADGQFKPHEFGKLIGHAVANDADICIGFRIARADGFSRWFVGRCWHLLTRLVLRYEATDVDCGFKIFRRHAVIGFSSHLSGHNASISPEILVRARHNGHKTVEIGVSHQARQYGVQTGNNLSVMTESLVGLWAFRRNFRNEIR